MALIDRIISAFTKTHSALPDRPSMTAADLKAWYDSSPNELKAVHNGLVNDLVATTDGASGADQVGAGPLFAGDVSAPATVMGKLKYLWTELLARVAAVQSQLSGIVLGQIPNGTITEVKLDVTLQSTIGSKALYKNGSGTFSSGGTTCTVTDAFITAATQVIVSPDPAVELAGSWKVVSAAGSFTITSTETEPVDVNFDWGATK